MIKDFDFKTGAWLSGASWFDRVGVQVHIVT